MKPTEVDTDPTFDLARRQATTSVQVTIDTLQLERIVKQAVDVLREDVEGQLSGLRALLEQAVQLLADGEPSALQREWLDRARAVLGGEGA